METNQLRVPRLPGLLGYAGLIPFVALSAALWLAPATYQVLINQALLLYASLILAFIGAVHWGLAMLMTNMDYQRQLRFSVIPALVAWFALFLPEILNYSVLIIAFALLCLFDTRMAKTGRAPSWYPHLRSPLTAVVVTSLIVAQLQYLPFH
ncbi:MAG: DUF3429 domain-containing protein [Halobacteria archaeon]|nr:DUF3429 domain-containing protein [Halobacteria archaeon]